MNVSDLWLDEAGVTLLGLSIRDEMLMCVDEELGDVQQDLYEARMYDLDRSALLQEEMELKELRCYMQGVP